MRRDGVGWRGDERSHRKRGWIEFNEEGENKDVQGDEKSMEVENTGEKKGTGRKRGRDMTEG